MIEFKKEYITRIWANIKKKLVVATSSSNGLMSSDDKTKLNGIATGAQVNVIESVKYAGRMQTISSKGVNIPVKTGTVTIKAGTTISNGYSVTLPIQYQVGNHSLEMRADTEVMQLATSTTDGHYKESGTSGSLSNKITIYRTSADGSWTLEEDLILTCIVKGVE